MLSPPDAFRIHNATTLSTATLTIKNLPDELYARLKAQARHQRRSINSEAIVCLERILQATPLDLEALIAEAEELHHRLGRDLDPGIIEEAKRERDARGPQGSW